MASEQGSWGLGDIKPVKRDIKFSKNPFSDIHMEV